MYSGMRREWNLEYAYRTTEINFSFVYVSFPPVEDPFQAITHHTDRPSDRDNICRDTSLFCCHALPPKWKRRGSCSKRTPTLICLINSSYMNKTWIKDRNSCRQLYSCGCMSAEWGWWSETSLMMYKISKCEMVEGGGCFAVLVLDEEACNRIKS